MNILAYNSSARGAGQFIRTLKIGHILTKSFSDANFLILAGNSYLEKTLPDRTDIIRLPRISKNIDGIPQTKLNSLKEVFDIRKGIIASVICNYNPDIFIVDSRPTGLNGELLELLKLLKKQNTKSILLLRDIVDSPEIVKQQWDKNNYYSLINILYDYIIILGERELFDASENYEFSEFRDKVHHIGYIGKYSEPNILINNENRTKEVLVTVGGGYDGEKVIDIVCRMISCNSVEVKFNIVLGGNTRLDIDNIKNKYNSILHQVRFYTHIDRVEDLMCNSEFVICMAGYNTIFELIEMRKKMIVIPRCVSGKEQLMRVEIISKYYDGIWSIPMDELSEESLRNKINKVLSSDTPKKDFPFSGKKNLIDFFRTEIL